MVKRRTQGGSSSGVGGGKVPKSKRKKQSNKDDALTTHDVFEADEVEADEDAHAYRYDDVENNEYELPEDFEDEEIEEDEAFNSEDERMYGHFFRDSGSSEEEPGEDEMNEGFDALESSDDSGDDEAWPGMEDDECVAPFDDDVYPDIEEEEQQKDIGSEESDGDEEQHDVAREHVMHQKKQLMTEAYPESVFHISAQGMYTYLIMLLQ